MTSEPLTAVERLIGSIRFMCSPEPAQVEILALLVKDVQAEARADAEREIERLRGWLGSVVDLPPITDEDGDCAFCWGANHSSDEPVDEGGHHSWCPYVNDEVVP